MDHADSSSEDDVDSLGDVGRNYELDLLSKDDVEVGKNTKSENDHKKVKKKRKVKKQKNNGKS